MQTYDGANHVNENVSVWTGNNFPRANHDIDVEDDGPAPLARLPDRGVTHPPIVHTARGGVK